MDNGAAVSLHSNGTVWTARAAGIFTWDVEANTLYGEAVVAGFFGLNASQTIEGLPLQDYLASLHPDDKPRIARAIHAAIVDGTPYQEEYRLLDRDGSYLWVLAIGHCFHNRDRSPSIYAGVIYDITEQKSSTTDGLLDHCNAALHVARRLGNPKLIALLKQALGEAEGETYRTAMRSSVRH